jgi:hypothetical protein
MRLQADVALVAIGQQRRHLALPLHTPRSQRTPDRRFTVHVAILRGYRLRIVQRAGTFETSRSDGTLD